MSHSRNYYISTENMSDIKQSIQQYSMNFQKQSAIQQKIQSQSRSQIAQMISGSYARSGTGRSALHGQVQKQKPGMNQAQGKQKQKLKQKQKSIIQQENIYHQENYDNQGRDTKKPVYLGEQIWKVIRQRYFQTMKIQTDDPEVLYDFFISQRKQINKMKPIRDEDIERQMPSMQRKLMIKKKFQTILTYYPEDVYYTLCCEVEKNKKDRELQQKVQFFNRGAQNSKNKVSQNQMKTIVDRLYKTKTSNFNLKQSKIPPQQIQKIQRNKFGKSLSQHYQNAHRQKGSPTNIQTVDKLYKYWQNIFENQREQYNIEWPEQTARQAIQQYMYEQIQDLMAYANKKLGFKCGKAVSLFKLYQKNYHQMQNIFIPLNSFEQYVKVYNEVQKRKQQHKQTLQKQNQTKAAQSRKKSEVKKFGRPVSATPITILSKPKTQTATIQGLATKYPQDKLIRNLMTEEYLRKPRFGFQYGVYDIQQEVKMKQWVKIDPKKPQVKYEDMISKKLSQTFSNPEFYKGAEETQQVMSLLAEENLEKKDTWKELGPVLHQAMLVKAHQQPWFRDCILRYMQRTTGQSLKLQTNQVIFNKLFSHLNSLQQSQKQSQFQKLQTIILTSQGIAQKTKKIQQMTKQPSKTESSKQKSLFRSFLQQKAIQYVRMRVKKTNDKFTLRSYLNQLYQQCLKQHKPYLLKQFAVLPTDTECPKLLKYEFFRYVKEINPITFQREGVLKNHAWVPTKKQPENFNYKSYNAFSEFYSKDRNMIVAEKERDGFRETIWGRGKGTDRENLMMRYEDAKECVFQPRVSKKV